ncbi:CTP synthase, partial [bacterium]|nr:CTP synthase [bacterium]
MSHPHVRFVFVTGGVISGLGKGIVASSLGMLLKSQGYKVTIQKFDPYFNLDPGTMNPYEHGEVFVTHDGGETDLDLGHYERFIDEELSRANSVTSGMVMWDVLNRERKGDYLGNTVMVIPQVAGDIKQRITKTLEQRPVDVVITEIGGTVGDIEAMWFLEAARQFQAEHRDRCVHIHVTLVPFLRMSGEFKTKPTQHSVKALREAGVSADIVVLRSEKPLGAAVKEKTSMLCSVPSVLECVDAKSIYDVPLQLAREGLDEVVLKHLQLPTRQKNLTAWQGFVDTLHNPQLP